MSSNPPSSFTGKLKLAFQNVLSNLNRSNSRPQTHQNSLITMQSSSDFGPPSFFSGMPRLAFQNVLSNLNPSNSRPQTHQNSLITMQSSSDLGPPSSFSGMLGLAFQNVLSNLNPSNSRPQTHQNSLITMQSSSNFVTTNMWFTFIAPHNRNTHLPVSRRDIQVDMSSPPTTSDPSSLSKTIIKLAALCMFQTASLPPIVSAAMVIAFAASFSEGFLKNSYPRAARVIEKIGYISFALGFFGMIRQLLSGPYLWLGWLAWALSMVSFIPHIHGSCRNSELST